MSRPPYDQRIARLLIRPLAGSGVTPNQLTAFTLLLTLIAAALFAIGDVRLADLAAGLFVLGRFLDHFDGELARLTGQASKFGYYFDYLAGGVSHAALFLGIGIGLSESPLGPWSLVLGSTGAGAAVVSMLLNLDLDRLRRLDEGEAVGYPAWGGFELEDGIYLLAPITWLGGLLPFFVLAGVGATLYSLWTMWQLLRLRALSGRS